jgi:hypothetical protein
MNAIDAIAEKTKWKKSKAPRKTLKWVALFLGEQRDGLTMVSEHILLTRRSTFGLVEAYAVTYTRMLCSFNIILILDQHAKCLSDHIQKLQ